MVAVSASRKLTIIVPAITQNVMRYKRRGAPGGVNYSPRTIFRAMVWPYPTTDASGPAVRRDRCLVAPAEVYFARTQVFGRPVGLFHVRSLRPRHHGGQGRLQDRAAAAVRGRRPGVPD